jgi:hypothetical protein
MFKFKVLLYSLFLSVSVSLEEGHFPYFQLSYCEPVILVVGEHVCTSIIKWNTITRLICMWSTNSIIIKWLIPCRQLTTITSVKARPEPAGTVYLLPCFLVLEVPLTRQIEQHCTTITSIATIRWPLSDGVAADAFTCVFDFEQGDRGSLSVTSWVEVFLHPPMDRPTVKKLGYQ